jgi:hypothetical protein
MRSRQYLKNQTWGRLRVRYVDSTNGLARGVDQAQPLVEHGRSSAARFFAVLRCAGYLDPLGVPTPSLFAAPMCPFGHGKLRGYTIGSRLIVQALLLGSSVHLRTDRIFHRIRPRRYRFLHRTLGRPNGRNRHDSADSKDLLRAIGVGGGPYGGRSRREDRGPAPDKPSILITAIGGPGTSPVCVPRLLHGFAQQSTGMIGYAYDSSVSLPSISQLPHAALVVADTGSAGSITLRWSRRRELWGMSC